MSLFGTRLIFSQTLQADCNGEVEIDTSAISSVSLWEIYRYVIAHVPGVVSEVLQIGGKETLESARPEQ